MGVNQKIAVLCNYQLLPERVGGMDYFFWLFDERCKENNIQVDWFFPNASSHEGYKKLKITSCNYENIEHFFTNKIVNSESNYSHVITHFIEVCSPIFKKIKLLTRAKIIVVDHNPRPLSGYSLKKRLEKKTKGILYSKYIDLFVGVSNYTVNEIINDFGKQVKNKSITIYNGVLIDNIKKRENKNYLNPTFLVASHLRKSKGIQDLIIAVSLLQPELIDKIYIDIYGDGPYKSILMNKVKEAQLEKNFNFKGSKSNLKEIFWQYDYMLQPTHMECFSLSILESLSANVPVITTNVGGNEEAIVNTVNGFIFNAKDCVALSNILQNVLLGEAKIISNTRTLIEEQFSLEKMVINHLNLLQ